MKNKRSYYIGSEGFSLLEVIVAVAILGAGMAMIAQVISGGLRSAFMSQKYVKAVTYSESKLGEIFLEETLTQGTDSGEFSDEESFWWETEIVPTEQESAEDEGASWVKTFKISVRVFFHEYGDEKSVELESIRVQVVKSDEVTEQ